MQKRRARLHLGRKRVCARFSSGERWEKKGVGRAVQGEEKRERERGKRWTFCGEWSLKRSTRLCTRWPLAADETSEAETRRKTVGEGGVKRWRAKRARANARCTRNHNDDNATPRMHPKRTDEASEFQKPASGLQMHCGKPVFPFLYSFLLSFFLSSFILHLFQHSSFHGPAVSKPRGLLSSVFFFSPPPLLFSFLFLPPSVSLLSSICSLFIIFSFLFFFVFKERATHAHSLFDVRRHVRVKWNTAFG